MSNLNDNDGGDWKNFKGIAEYTKRNLTSELMKVIYSHQDVFDGMNITDFIWPKDYTLNVPTFINDPMYGFGIFENPDSPVASEETNPYTGGNKVNYLMATSPEEIVEFYATLAACMLSGSSSKERTPGSAAITESGGPKDYNSYKIEVPNSGVSALMCFFFSKDGINDVVPMGPDPENPGEQTDYKVILRKTQDDTGWANGGTMRNDWYETPGESKQFNISTLTIINPTPGEWTIYIRGKDGKNRSLHTYVTLVSGAEVNIQFAQGNGLTEYPVTDGDFIVKATQVKDNVRTPLTDAFYSKLKLQCDAMR